MTVFKVVLAHEVAEERESNWHIQIYFGGSKHWHELVMMELIMGMWEKMLRMI